ncbi:J domain-containing protein [Hyphomicrobium sp.]|uniref:J domain-containing protein n=1 Tax=Hyphomicrobium sp. TaxID=82 RepID=UPI002D780790|nr:J domain-containing protein [Hyphomicrobium sp.]HET6389282.1 J domain-containing protein [Hyphomicrobium sp.]
MSVALDLIRMPTQVRIMRSAPLPPGVLLLLRLAASETGAECEAEEINKRSSSANRDAAIFFIEQVLLATNSDAYRVLGLDRRASSAELRRHMAYLLKWLHPDVSGDPHKARLAQRVLMAWNEVKSAERMPTEAGDHALRAGSRPLDAASRPLSRSRPESRHKTAAYAPSARLARRLRRRVWPL